MRTWGGCIETPNTTSTSAPTVLAHDHDLDRAVVLFFLPETDPARDERLSAAAAFARAAHPNLAAIHFVRERGERPHVVSAFVPGERLSSVAGPLPDARVLEVGRALAGALDALHDAGAAHGNVCADRVIVTEDGAPCLVGLEEGHDGAQEEAKVADVRALVALLVALAGPHLKEQLTPFGDSELGVASADELRRALTTIGRTTITQASLSENPYRGLRPFDREHAGLFFGREREVAELCERLRAQPWLLLAGRSGAGKSSLARAGVAPALAGAALSERVAWDIDPLDRSPFGVLDMGGNVREWALGVKGERAARGGYWLDVAFNARSAQRGVGSYVRRDGVGVRVCAAAPRTP